MSKISYENHNNPFYILTNSFLLISVFLSFTSCLDKKNKNSYANDFYPNTKDKKNYRKIIWYFSQLTYQTQIILTIYFLLKFKKINFSFNHLLFKIIAPACLCVNIQYFLILFPKRKKNDGTQFDIHDMEYNSIVPHLLDSIIIFIELLHLENFHLKHIFLYLYYLIFAISFTLFNKFIRNQWTYNLLILNKMSGWELLIKSTFLMQLISYLLFIIHKQSKKKNKLYLIGLMPYLSVPTLPKANRNAPSLN